MEKEAPKEIETRKPILELQINPKTKVVFLNLDQFSSPGVRTLRVHDIPPIVEEIAGKSERTRSKSGINTYNNTVNQPDWQRNIYSFVNHYVHGDGRYIKDKLGIEGIHHLTPKQAIELTVLVLKDLTKYKLSDAVDLTPEQRQKLIAEGVKIDPLTQADKSTVLELLQAGLDNRADPAWEGNGVCRNFAWMGKAMFESLRDSIQGGPLSTTYSLYDAGYAFAPKRAKKNAIAGRMDSTHAWNQYLVVDPSGKVEVTVADFTWASGSSDGSIVNLDHTKERIEPLVFELAQKIEGDDSQKKRELKKVFSYYADNISNPVESAYATKEEFKEFFASRALALVKQTASHNIVPTDLIDAIVPVYKQLGSQASLGELTILHDIIPGTAVFEEVLDSYLKDIKLSAYRYHEVFSDNQRLQRAILFGIREKPDFQTFIKEAPAMRVRCREVGFADLLPPFDPTKNQEDVGELRYLLDQSQYLRNTNIDKFHLMSPERLTSLYAMLRRELKERNPSLNPEQIDRTPSYTLLTNFDYLVKQHSAA